MDLKQLIRITEGGDQANNRLLEIANHVERQRRFVENILRNPIADMADKLVQATTIMQQLNGPMANIALQMERDWLAIQNCTVSAWEIIQRSVEQQNRLAALFKFHLHEYLEPLMQFDGGGENSTSLYLLQLPESSPEDPEGIIQVTGALSKDLVQRFSDRPSELRNLGHRQFEELIAELFSGFGYEVELTLKTRDGGRDVIAIRKREVVVKYLIECKRPRDGTPVRIQPVRELLGVKAHERATKAILATTTFFTPDAIRFSKEHEWELELRDFEGLQCWFVDYLQIKTSQKPEWASS